MRLLFLSALLLSCNGSSPSGHIQSPRSKTIGEIPLPNNYSRIVASDDSFANWLRKIPLKADNTVYLYNGNRKKNQSAQFAVLEVPVGNKDLQQCADAIMRLRAEFLRDSGQEEAIAFHATDGTLIDYASWKEGHRFLLVNGRLKKRKVAEKNNSRASFEAYLQCVFMYCGTLSLEKELIAVSPDDVQPGDVFIRGGSPGHAVIVADVIINKKNQKKFMLAQSYMPAQDIHVLKNPLRSEIDPWYEIPSGKKLYTPEWIFDVKDIMRFVDRRRKTGDGRSENAKGKRQVFSLRLLSCPSRLSVKCSCTFNF